MLTLKKRLGAATLATLPSVVAIALALFVSGILLIIAGHNPLSAYARLINGAFGSSNRIAETLIRSIPITVMALGTSVAFRCKIWNIGGNGQYTAGAILGLAMGVYSNLPALLLLPLTIAASLLAGVLVGALVGFLKAKLNANEVITTLMLDYVLIYLLSYLVNGPMMDPGGHGFPQTKLIPHAMRLPILLPGTRLHFGIIISLLMVIAAIIFWKSKVGFQISMVGESHDVARYSGIQVNKKIILTMMISAAMAAFAGWIDVYGLHFRLQENLPGSLGSIAIVVALLGQLNPVGIAFASFFFSALVVGGSTMQRFEGVPYSLVGVVQGLVIVFVISKVVYDRYRDKRSLKRYVH